MRSWLDSDLANLLAKYFGEKFSRKPPTDRDCRAGPDQAARSGTSLQDEAPVADTRGESGRPELAP